jgi:hypothetical protein
MNSERILKEAVTASSKYYYDIFLEETTKILNLDNRCTDRDSNRELTEYKSRELPLDQPYNFGFDLVGKLKAMLYPCSTKNHALDIYMAVEVYIRILNLDNRWR